MTYQETTDFLFNQIPMFEKQGKSGYKPGLDTTLLLDRHFGHPHRNYKTIHVAGTNGKGSCSHTIAAILQLCGYKVGLYTSPHLLDFRERIRVNGIPVSEQYVVDFVEHEKSFFLPLKPSFFEITTAMAFKYFNDMEVDVAVVEVGLGGRLDCTNIIQPVLSVITNVSLDHTQFLGNSIESIAKEKGGIIKANVPVVIGEYNDTTKNIFLNIAAERSTEVVFAEDNQEVLHNHTDGKARYYTTKSFGEIKGCLTGEYQVKNTNTILNVYKLLKDIFQINADENNLLGDAFSKVDKLTGLQGRWQKVSECPLTLCDTGHNLAGWHHIASQLSTIKCRHLHIVFGMVDDKDYKSVISILPQNAFYYFTQTNSKRSLDKDIIKREADSHGLKGACFEDVHEAYNSAKNNANEEDAIFVGGSTYIVSDFLKEMI